jgi:hypothetical protein
MLTIRREQFSVFDQVTEAAFIRRVVEHLAEEHSDTLVKTSVAESTLRELPGADLHEMVRRGVERARAYGLTWESSLTSFVVLMFVVAPNFDEHPLIKRVLQDNNVEPDLRIDRLWELTSEENWEAAAAGYDAGAWEPRRAA